MVVIAMPVATCTTWGVNRLLPKAAPGLIVFLAALVPAGLFLIPCIIRMNISLNPGDWGGFAGAMAAMIGTPIVLVLGVIAAVMTLRRVRGYREE